MIHLEKMTEGEDGRHSTTRGPKASSKVVTPLRTHVDLEMEVTAAASSSLQR